MPEEIKQKPARLLDLIKPEMGETEIKEIIANFITAEDEKMLGGKEKAIEKVTDSVAFLGPFAPAPSTFNEAAFFDVAAFELPEQEAKRILEIDKRMGVIDDAPDQPGRISVSKEVVKMAQEQLLTD